MSFDLCLQEFSGTGTFSGYIGSTCLEGNNLAREDAAKVTVLLCGRSYIWDAKGQPPRDPQSATSPVVFANFLRDGINTFGLISPTEGMAPACGGGTYPRSLSEGECEKAFARLLDECESPFSRISSINSVLTKARPHGRSTAMGHRGS